MKKLLALMLLVGCQTPEVTAIKTIDIDAKVDGGEIEEEEPLVVEEEPVPARTVEAINVRDMLFRMRQVRHQRMVPWRLPSDEELRARSIRDLLVTCISEEGWASPVGCKALWQVAWQTRGCISQDGLYAVSCNDPDRLPRRRAPQVTGLWRIARHVTGMVPTTTFRQRWVASIDVSCERPEHWPERTRDGTRDYADWENYRPLCEELMEVIPSIVDGTDGLEACPEESIPIAWGCDPFRRRAQREILDVRRPLRGCNDTPIALRRGLERLNCGETENAYWCRPGTPHCGTLPESEVVLRTRLCSEEGASDAEPGLCGGGDTVQEPREGLQRGDAADLRPMVLDLHELSGDGERRSEGDT